MYREIVIAKEYYRRSVKQFISDQVRANNAALIPTINRDVITIRVPFGNSWVKDDINKRLVTKCTKLY